MAAVCPIWAFRFTLYAGREIESIFAVFTYFVLPLFAPSLSVLSASPSPPPPSVSSSSPLPGSPAPPAADSVSRLIAAGHPPTVFLFVLLFRRQTRRCRRRQRRRRKHIGETILQTFFRPGVTLSLDLSIRGLIHRGQKSRVVVHPRRLFFASPRSTIAGSSRRPF